VNSKSEKITCPACSSENITLIMYGMPAFSSKLMEEIKSGETKLGGCCVRDDSPDYTCNSCGKEWKKEEKLGKD
jgi:DNA-directed RNA polymerase subunit RPC12/RpoP